MKWLQWEKGRQEGGYDKMMLLQSQLLRCDLYILRFPPGSEIKPHRDPVDGREHYRANLTVWPAPKGGAFVCENPLYQSRYFNFFRPDISTHSMTRVEGGSQYILSFGWAV